MTERIATRSTVKLGIVPTHLQFSEALIPSDAGRLPRDAAGRLVLLSGLERLMQQCPAQIDAAQIPYFPGCSADDFSELVAGLRTLGLEASIILMVAGANPMNPADEDAAVSMLAEGVTAAVTHGVSEVASASIEPWMSPEVGPLEGEALDAAIAQVATVHQRAFTEAGVAGSSIQAWHIEFLRKGEFQVFTDLRKAWRLVHAMNEGMDQPFFKVMVDAAHCGDSDISLSDHLPLIEEIAAADELGMLHASAKTTRGCLSTDDGWVGALLASCVATGRLRHAFVELFHHEDPVLEPLRALGDGHGVDTTDGRSMDQTVSDALVSVARRLNNLAARSG